MPRFSSVRHQRSRHFQFSVSRWGIFLGIILVGIGIGWWLLQTYVLQRATAPYEGIVVFSDPVTVIMHDKVAKKSAIFTLPNTIMLETKKYGTLSLSSLWRLGDIEKKQGIILMESLSDALGIPLSWYIGPKDAAKITLQQQRTFQALLAYTKFEYSTNMQLVDYLRFWFIARNTDLFFSPPFAIDSLSVIAKKSLPDGQIIETLDTNRLDILLGNKRELTTVRKEQLTVTVSNASGKTGIGQQIGRILSNIGVRIAAITTDTESITRCQLVGTRQSLYSITSFIIETYWGCTKKEIPTFERSDLILRIGSDVVVQ